MSRHERRGIKEAKARFVPSIILWYHVEFKAYFRKTV
jgi:hypothetical protein